MELLHSEITERIIAAFYRVHKVLRHGHLETVYERALEIELNKRELFVQRQVPARVYYEGHDVSYFLGDMIVERCVLLELKAAARIAAAHEAQLVNYLCASGLEIGLLLNFGLKPEVSRFVGPAARRRRK